MNKFSDSEKKYWNVIKGISISSIVLGHTCYFMSAYVYLYHLVIFFFITGYMFNADKYCKSPYAYFSVRFKGVYTKYVLYGSFFVLIHNILLKIGLILNQAQYGIIDVLCQLTNTLIFNCPETLSGAMWFIPVWLLSCNIFGISYYLSSKLSKVSNHFANKTDLIFLVINFLFGIVGYKFCKLNINFLFHIQTSLLVLPIMALGYFLSNKVSYNNLQKNLKFPFAFFIAIVLFLCVKKLNWRIELSQNITMNFLPFYFASMGGIYVCLYVGKYINKHKLISISYETIGIYSFDIMALHFLMVKIIDFIYAMFIKQLDPNIYGKFVYAFPKLWFIYFLSTFFIGYIYI